MGRITQQPSLRSPCRRDRQNRPARQRLHRKSPQSSTKKTLTISLQGLIVTERKHRPPCPGDEAAVYAALTPEPILADLLTEHTGLPPQRLLAAMTMLQIKGLAKKLPGNRYQRAGG